MALLPGGTESGFARVATEKSEELTKRYQNRDNSASGMSMQTSYDVALECLEGYEKNRQFVICGRSNRILNFVTGFMSRKAVLNLTGKMFKKIAG